MPRRVDQDFGRYDTDFTSSDAYLCMPAKDRNDAYLYLLAISGWSRRKLTDGHLPLAVAEDMARRLGVNFKRMVAALSGVGLLEVHDSDVFCVKYAKWGETRQEIEELRAARQEAGRLGGLASGETRRSKGEANASGLVEANGSRVRVRVETEGETLLEDSLTPVAPNGSTELSDFTLEVAHALEEVTGRTPSQATLTFLERLPASAPRLTADALATKYRTTAAKFVKLGKPMPAIQYLAQWCVEENARLCDQGERRPREDTPALAQLHRKASS